MDAIAVTVTEVVVVEVFCPRLYFQSDPFKTMLTAAVRLASDASTAFGGSVAGRLFQLPCE